MLLFSFKRGVPMVVVKLDSKCDINEHIILASQIYVSASNTKTLFANVLERVSRALGQGHKHQSLSHSNTKSKSAWRIFTPNGYAYQLVLDNANSFNTFEVDTELNNDAHI